MAGYKETPRQKMIGMLYLVLTALLALNVSKEILEAFVVVNETMETTNKNFSQKVDLSYRQFKDQYDVDPEKVGPFWDKAVQAQKMSDDLISYVDSLKFAVIAKTEKLETIQEAGDKKLAEINRKDNYDVPTQFFIGQSQDGEKNCIAAELRERIDLYRENMLNLVDEKYRNNIQIGLKTDGQYLDAQKVPQNWQMHNFNRTILVAAVTILNEIKAEILNAEYDVVNNLFASVSAKDFKFDALRAKVIPNSNYVFVGEEYEAEIIVAAYDNTQNPVVRFAMGVDSLSEKNYIGSVRQVGSMGIVTLKFPAGAPGEKKYAGFIKILGPLGDTVAYHFKESFIVAKPLSTVSPTKMNVFYREVDNPVSIAVPGNPETIKPVLSAGNIRRQGDDWIVYDLPKDVNEVTMTINAVFSGSTRNMGSSKFRVKTVPPPIATIAGVSSGSVQANLITAQPWLVAEMPRDFEFDLKYKISSFTVYYVNSSGYTDNIPVQGNRLTEEIVKLISTMRKNSMISFEQIRAIGPTGVERPLASISIRVN